MKIDDEWQGTRMACSGSTKAQLEAMLIAHLRANDRQSLCPEPTKEFDVSTFVNKMISVGYYKECSDHRGYYVVNQGFKL